MTYCRLEAKRERERGGGGERQVGAASADETAAQFCAKLDSAYYPPASVFANTL